MSPEQHLSYADDSRWPIVRLRWPGCPVSDESLERTYADAREMIQRGQHVMLVTFDDMHPHFTASQRSYIARFITSHRSVLQQYCRGLAIVSMEAEARGLVVALNWQSKAPFERAMFQDRWEAIRWLSHRWQEFVGGKLAFASTG